MAYSLRSLYQKQLLPYEEYCRMREEGQFDLLGEGLHWLEGVPGARGAAGGVWAAAGGWRGALR